MESKKEGAIDCCDLHTNCVFLGTKDNDYNRIEILLCFLMEDCAWVFVLNSWDSQLANDGKRGIQSEYVAVDIEKLQL